MSTRRLITILVVAISGLIIIGFIIPTETEPPKTTRIILEHNEETYIAPPCFNQSDASNNIGESTLEHAEEENYSPHSPCTEDALKSESNSLIIGWLKNMGILSTKWDNW